VCTFLGMEHIVIRAHRPLRELTDEELAALNTLADNSGMFAPEIAGPIAVLGEFATAEEAERQYALERARDKAKAKP
jgi:hypothetical protein